MNPLIVVATAATVTDSQVRQLEAAHNQTGR
jgi:hypothetical protein